MKKLAIMLIGLILFAVPFFPSVKSAQKPDYATLTLVELGLKDSIVFGKYEIKFADVSPDWTQAFIEIYEDGVKKANAVLSAGGEYLYPSDTNPLIRVSLEYLMSYKKTVYIEVGSPLDNKVESEKRLEEGATYTPTYLNGKVSIKLVDVTDTSATFKVTVNGISYTKTIDENDGQGFSYRINSDISYYPFVFIKVTNAVKNDYAEFDMYIPKYPTTTASIKRASSQTQEEETPTASPEIVVYNDIMYKDEILTVSYNSTTYKLRLNSVGLYSSFSLFKGNTPLETFQVKAGKSYESKKAPIEVEVPRDSYDTDYNRLTVKVWAPKEAEAQPIRREAKLKLLLDTSSKEIMLGDKLLITLRLVNEGKGKAFGLKLNPPKIEGLKQEVYPEQISVKEVDAFSEYPLVTYILTPSQVGFYPIDKFILEYYDEFGGPNNVTSEEIGQLKVYALPEIQIAPIQGYFKVNLSKEEQISVAFNISAKGENREFMFIRNATLKLELPEGLEGPNEIYIGDLRAGESMPKKAVVNVLSEGIFTVSAVLEYYDPLGNKHQEEFPNLVLINSIPPQIVEKPVKVYPEPDELPSYIKDTLSSLDNEERLALAEEIKNITQEYIPPEPAKTNWWAVFAIIFLITTIGFGVAYYNYKAKYEEVSRKLEKRKRRKGGLPKKAEEIQKTSPKSEDVTNL
ncbi:hypothetical protein PAP_09110 [Palaeococcus pacificus DY20341]|uniref:DNA cytosine methyltransferase n=1 Tax=Palaeococcus pacificus DY20341 TaxID=1343739 RepID=A0A075LW11_9EURY|nr:hypothetical protein [Palaeococcus pacificus]AIF70202.1 hypothetical protein PAP_09110 [Palaeococcus pacificus DY20341]